MKRISVLAAAFVWAAAVSTALAQQLDFRLGEVVVKASPAALPDGVELIRYLPHAGLSVVKAERGQEMAQVRKLGQHGHRAALNRVAYATATVPDGFYRQGLQWNFTRVDVETAWESSRGRGVVVAVLDSGLRLGGLETPTNLLILAGSDIVNRDDDPSDDLGHGTHVSGTIAQETGNDTEEGTYGGGCAGIAYEATIMPVKVLGADGSGSFADIAEGICFAVNQGAQVINMSLGTAAVYAIASDPVMDPALDYAYDEGVVVVCAAGNDASRVNVSYPAMHPTTIAVGATDFANKVTRYSNKGAGLDLVAPGGDTGKDLNGDGYADGIMQETYSASYGWSWYFYQGTSMAAPHVTAIVALMLALDDALTPDQVRAILAGTALDLGATGYDSTSGYGLAQAGDAVLTVQPVHDVTVSSVTAPAGASPGDPVGVTVVVANPGDFPEAIDLTLEVAGPGYDVAKTIGTATVASLATGASLEFPFTWDTAGLPAGSYTLTARIADVAEETHTADNVRSVVIGLADPGQTTMLTGSVALQLVKTGANVVAQVTVGVSDSTGNAVPAAAVTVLWDGVASGTGTGVTDATGSVVIKSAVLKKPKSGSTVTVTLTDISKEGCSWDGAAVSTTATVP